MKNENWTLVDTKLKFEELLDLALDFHDAVSRTSRWIGAEYLSPSRHLALDGFGTLVVSTISQFAEVPDLELRFGKVHSFHYEYGGELTPEIEFTSDGIRAALMEWIVEAESMQYRILPIRTFGMPDLEP